MGNNDFYRSLIYEAPFGFMRVKMFYDECGNVCDYQVIDLNPCFEKICGVPKETIIGYDYKDTPLGKNAKWMRHLQDFTRICKNGEPASFELYSQSNNQWIKVYLQPSDKDFFSIFLRDISQSRTIETELEEKKTYIDSLISSVPDTMLILDRDRNIQYLKQSEKEPIFPEGVLASGKSLFDFIPEEARNRFETVLDSLFEAQDVEALHFETHLPAGLRRFECRFKLHQNTLAILMIRDVSIEHQALRGLQEHSEFQYLITEISALAVKSNPETLTLVIDEILSRVGTYFRASKAHLFQYSKDYQHLYKSNHWYPKGKDPFFEKGELIPTQNTPWWHEKIMNGEIIIIRDQNDLPESAVLERKILIKADIQSILIVPILIGDKVRGYFDFDFVGEKWDVPMHLVGNLKMMANILSEVIQKQEIEQAIQHQNELQIMLSKMATHYINLPSEQLRASIQDSLEEMGMFTQADRAYVFDYHWDLGVAENTYEWTSAGTLPRIQQFQALPLELISAWQNLHRQGKYIFVEDVNTLPDSDPIKKLIHGQDVVSIIAIPMMQDANCIGFVGFEYLKNKQVFSDKEITLLELFSRLLVNVRSRIALEDKLRLSKEKAEAANNAKSEFLANMSHEIRTPLNAIIGFSEILYNSRLSSSQKIYAQNIGISSHKLLAIINDILDFSKIEAGKLELELIKSDIIELVEHAADIIKLHTAQKGVDFLLEIALDMPRYAVIDPLRVHQILVNILSNAAKFTLKGEVHLKMDYRYLDADFAEITISVRDTGIGIKESHQDKLFEAFSQLDSSTTRRFGGTGLGLSISNALAQMMDSQLTLKSAENEGSTFSFSIKAQVEADDKSTPPQLNYVKRVLLVDKNPGILRILSNELRHWNLDVLTVDSSLQALETLRQDQGFQLILIDSNLPFLSGLNTLKMLDAELPQLKESMALGLMSDPTDDILEIDFCLNVGNCHRILKPIKRLQLKELLLSVDGQELEKPDENEENGEATSQSLYFPQAPKILLAEDNELNLALLEALIRQIVPQAQLIYAKDGKEAVDKCFEEEPDLIYMDLQMPNMDGISASYEIRKKYDTPIIAVSAGALVEERERCMKAGMNGFLSKPLSSEVLLKSIQSHLGHANLENPASPEAQDSNPYFNAKLLLDNLSQDKETFTGLLEIVLNTFPEKLKALENALDPLNITDAKSILHSLRGSSQNMYFGLLADSVSRLERSIDLLGMDDIKLMYQKILNQWEILKDIIKDFEL